MTTATALDAPSIWATTYGLYNQGRLIGKWFDLTDYSNKDEFIEAVTEFLKPHDPDPEIMFCDWQRLPDGMVSECFVDESVWEWLELSEEDQELLKVYQDQVCGQGYSTTVEDAREAFVGKYDSKSDWAYERIEESGMLSEVPSELRGYIDYESYANDAESGDMTFVHHNNQYWAFRAI